MSAYRIGVLGAGAMGCLFAHGLARVGGPEVVLLARSPGPDWVEVGERVAVRRLTEPTALTGPLDLLLVLVKAHATADAIRWAAGAVGPETVLLTLQNGLGNAEALVTVARPEQILVGTTAQGATLLAPDLVRHGGSGPTRIAPWAGSEAAPAVASLLSAAGFPTEVVADWRPLLWSKLLVNAVINPLTALLGLPNGALLERPEARRLMSLVAGEVRAVAQAQGIELGSSTADPAHLAFAVAQATATNRSSMLQDLERGRRTEIGAINGAVVAAARALGIPTPVNEALTLLVQAREQAP